MPPAPRTHGVHPSGVMRSNSGDRELGRLRTPFIVCQGRRDAGAS
jgi:hypothetical protein